MMIQNNPEKYDIVPILYVSVHFCFDLLFFMCVFIFQTIIYNPSR